MGKNNKRSSKAFHALLKRKAVMNPEPLPGKVDTGHSLVFEEAGTSSKPVEGLSTGTGLIFLCNRATKVDCYTYGVFGLPDAQKDLVKQIKEGTYLFLFDIDSKILYGVYMASSCGGYYLEPDAFKKSKKAFPWQVRFHIHDECIPLSEDIFKPAIKENYYDQWKFKNELSAEQVQKLLKLFKPLPPLGAISDVLDGPHNHSWDMPSYLEHDCQQGLPVSSYQHISYAAEPIVKPELDQRNVISDVYAGYDLRVHHHPALRTDYEAGMLSNATCRAKYDGDMVREAPLAQELSSFSRTISHHSHFPEVCLLGANNEASTISDEALLRSRSSRLSDGLLSASVRDSGLFSKTKYYRGNAAW